MPTTPEWDTAALVAADKRHVWHPFTAMGEWCAPDHEPLVLVKGEGALLWDSKGRKYIDGNSSIWTNIHGHNHPHINAAIRRQLDRVAHTSFLGFTNPAAIELAEAMVALFPPNTLSRVFFSDDGSTGMEAALRITAQYWKLRASERSQFVAFAGGYHGDTAGAASLGAAAMFNGRLSGWNFPATRISSLDELKAMAPEKASRVAAVVIEPSVQGAAGVRLWPHGTLSEVRAWCDQTGALLIADEVLTGFGRTGKMFACQHEDVIPDLIILGKALTGGYLPVALTLLKEEVFEPFASSIEPESTLFYGHSYTGNALGCAAAKASLEIFAEEKVLECLAVKIEILRRELEGISALSAVSEVRQCGFIAGIELDARAGGAERGSGSSLGAAVCRAARFYGLLTRPIRDVVVLMPPYCITESELEQAVLAVRQAISYVLESDARAEAKS